MPYAVIASLLTLLAAAPRVEILHHYVQNRLEADIAAATRAVARHLRIELSDAELATILPRTL